MFLQLGAIICVCVLIWKNVIFICLQDFSAQLEKEILSSGDKLYFRFHHRWLDLYVVDRNNNKKCLASLVLFFSSLYFLTTFSAAKYDQDNTNIYFSVCFQALLLKIYMPFQIFLIIKQFFTSLFLRTVLSQYILE